MKKRRKIVVIILIIILLIIMVMAGICIYYLNNKFSKINYVDIKEEDIEINEGVDLKKKGYRNIAIFGVDSRADVYSDTRSDCIIIASINQETNDVNLISVYRDTYLDIDGHGLDKVTHAYAYGGAELAINTLNKNLDLDIKEFISVNFGAVVDIINSVGGIDINIEENEIKYINGYISEIDRIEGTTTEKITKKGTQTLTGVQALAYSRIRYTEGGDYKRTERMRDVLTATFDKAKKLNILELNNILDMILPETYTNIKIDEIKKMIPEIIKYNVRTSLGWPYEVKGITLDRWYGVPVTLEENVKKLHTEIFGEENYMPSEKVTKISNDIIKNTGYK